MTVDAKKLTQVLEFFGGNREFFAALILRDVKVLPWLQADKGPERRRFWGSLGPLFGILTRHEMLSDANLIAWAKGDFSRLEAQLSGNELLCEELWAQIPLFKKSISSWQRFRAKVRPQGPVQIPITDIPHLFRYAELLSSVPPDVHDLELFADDIDQHPLTQFFEDLGAFATQAESEVIWQRLRVIYQLKIASNPDQAAQVFTVTREAEEPLNLFDQVFQQLALLYFELAECADLEAKRRKIIEKLTAEKNPSLYLRYFLLAKKPNESSKDVSTNDIDVLLDYSVRLDEATNEQAFADLKQSLAGAIDKNRQVLLKETSQQLTYLNRNIYGFVPDRFEAVLSVPVAVPAKTYPARVAQAALAANADLLRMLTSVVRTPAVRDTALAETFVFTRKEGTLLASISFAAEAYADCKASSAIPPQARLVNYLTGLDLDPALIHKVEVSDDKNQIFLELGVQPIIKIGFTSDVEGYFSIIQPEENAALLKACFAQVKHSKQQASLFIAQLQTAKTIQQVRAILLQSLEKYGDDFKAWFFANPMSAATAEAYNDAGASLELKVIRQAFYLPGGEDWRKAFYETYREEIDKLHPTGNKFFSPRISHARALVMADQSRRAQKAFERAKTPKDRAASLDELIKGGDRLVDFPFVYEQFAELPFAEASEVFEELCDQNITSAVELFRNIAVRNAVLARQLLNAKPELTDFLRKGLFKAGSPVAPKIALEFCLPMHVRFAEVSPADPITDSSVADPEQMKIILQTMHRLQRDNVTLTLADPIVPKLIQQSADISTYQVEAKLRDNSTVVLNIEFGKLSAEHAFCSCRVTMPERVLQAVTTKCAALESLQSMNWLDRRLLGPVAKTTAQRNMLASMSLRRYENSNKFRSADDRFIAFQRQARGSDVPTTAEQELDRVQAKEKSFLSRLASPFKALRYRFASAETLQALMDKDFEDFRAEYLRSETLRIRIDRSTNLSKTFKEKIAKEVPDSSVVRLYPAMAPAPVVRIGAEATLAAESTAAESTAAVLAQPASLDVVAGATVSSAVSAQAPASTVAADPTVTPESVAIQAQSFQQVLDEDFAEFHSQYLRFAQFREKLATMPDLFEQFVKKLIQVPGSAIFQHPDFEKGVRDILTHLVGDGLYFVQMAKFPELSVAFGLIAPSDRASVVNELAKNNRLDLVRVMFRQIEVVGEKLSAEDFLKKYVSSPVLRKFFAEDTEAKQKLHEAVQAQSIDYSPYIVTVENDPDLILKMYLQIQSVKGTKLTEEDLVGLITNDQTHSLTAFATLYLSDSEVRELCFARSSGQKTPPLVQKALKESGHKHIEKFQKALEAEIEKAATVSEIMALSYQAYVLLRPYIDNYGHSLISVFANITEQDFLTAFEACVAQESTKKMLSLFLLSSDLFIQKCRLPEFKMALYGDEKFFELLVSYAHGDLLRKLRVVLGEAQFYERVSQLNFDRMSDAARNHIIRNAFPPLQLLKFYEQRPSIKLINDEFVDCVNQVPKQDRSPVVMQKLLEAAEKAIAVLFDDKANRGARTDAAEQLPTLKALLLLQDETNYPVQALLAQKVNLGSFIKLARSASEYYTSVEISTTTEEELAQRLQVCNQALSNICGIAEKHGLGRDVLMGCCVGQLRVILTGELDLSKALLLYYAHKSKSLLLDIIREDGVVERWCRDNYNASVAMVEARLSSKLVTEKVVVSRGSVADPAANSTQVTDRRGPYYPPHIRARNERLARFYAAQTSGVTAAAVAAPELSRVDDQQLVAVQPTRATMLDPVVQGFIQFTQKAEAYISSSARNPVKEVELARVLERCNHAFSSALLNAERQGFKDVMMQHYALILQPVLNGELNISKAIILYAIHQSHSPLLEVIQTSPALQPWYQENVSASVEMVQRRLGLSTTPAAYQLSTYVGDLMRRAEPVAINDALFAVVVGATSSGSGHLVLRGSISNAAADVAVQSSLTELSDDDSVRGDGDTTSLYSGDSGGDSVSDADEPESLPGAAPKAAGAANPPHHQSIASLIASESQRLEALKAASEAATAADVPQENQGYAAKPGQ